MRQTAAKAEVATVLYDFCARSQTAKTGLRERKWDGRTRGGGGQSVRHGRPRTLGRCRARAIGFGKWTRDFEKLEEGTSTGTAATAQITRNHSLFFIPHPPQLLLPCGPVRSGASATHPCARSGPYGQWSAIIVSCMSNVSAQGYASVHVSPGCQWTMWHRVRRPFYSMSMPFKVQVPCPFKFDWHVFVSVSSARTPIRRASAIASRAEVQCVCSI